jgi:hypothetical protein
VSYKVLLSAVKSLSGLRAGVREPCKDRPFKNFTGLYTKTL